jgi:PleD family two-component response regulator
MDNYTVLAVNDDPGQLEIINLFLKNAGFNVRDAGDGREAYKIARKEKPDLIISDVMMPECDGIELCQLIRNDKELRFTPILLVSALQKDTESVVRGLEAGADDYLESPFEPMRLIAKAARLVERKRMEDALLESENRFRSLIENLTDIITVLTPDGTIIYESPSLETVLGYKPEEIIGKNAFEFVHPEDAATVLAYFLAHSRIGRKAFQRSA